MAPVVKALAQSESKSRFMERLGLNEQNPDHKQLYHMMKVGISTQDTPSRHRAAFLTKSPGRGQRRAQKDYGHAQCSSEQ